MRRQQQTREAYKTTEQRWITSIRKKMSRKLEDGFDREQEITSEKKV